MMWAAWTVFALAQIATARWLKGTFPGSNMWAHRIFAAFITVITLMFGLWAF
jgi:hypothetical protein